MPIWKENMTEEDYEQIMLEWRQERKRQAYDLRAQARFLLAAADRIDPPTDGKA